VLAAFVASSVALTAAHLVRVQTCFGVPVRRAVPAPSPNSARLNAHQADVAFRFSCAGRATHVVQPPAKPGGKVVLPYCEGLEVRFPLGVVRGGCPRL